MIKKLAMIALSTTCLIPLGALADDEFGITEESAVAKPAPVYFSFIEVGAGYSSDNPLAAARYSGRSDDGVFPVGSLSYLYRQPYTEDGAEFLRVNGSSFGYDARRLSVEGGEQGSYKAFFGYETLPHSSFQGMTAFTGVGTSTLSLVPGWTKRAGPTSLTAADLNKLTPVDIRTQRERFGSGLTWHMDPQYSMRVAARHETKEGLRAQGVNLSSPNAAFIAPAPVNYQDDQVDTEIAFAGKRAQWRMGYNLSLFRSRDNAFIVDNPFTTTQANAREQVSQAPDNTAHSFFADGGYQFSDTTRLVTNLSYSQYLQDDTFLPYSFNQTVARNVPRQSLDGRISTITANAELTTRPLAHLDMKTRYRFTDRRNDTPVSEFVYISSDGPGAVSEATSRFRRNIPYSYKENLISNDFGYAVTPRTKISTGYEFREFQRSQSERNKNIDNTGYVGIRSGLAEGLTGNAKYSRMWRDGSTYSPQGSLVNTNNAALINTNVYDNNPLLRKYYEADLIRDRVQTGLNYAPTDALTLGVSGGLTVDEYVRSELGLTDAVATNATLDASYQASPALSLSGFYTYERRVTDLAGQQATGGTLAQNLAALNDASRRWWVNMAEDAHTVGGGSKWQMREDWKLLFDYAFVWTVTETDPSKNGSTALPAAASFPDLTSKSHSFSARAEYDLTDTVVIGFGYALELYRSKDWALDNVNVNSTTVMNMAEQSPNYNAHLFLPTTRAKF